MTSVSRFDHLYHIFLSTMEVKSGNWSQFVAKHFDCGFVLATSFLCNNPFYNVLCVVLVLIAFLACIKNTNMQIGQFLVSFFFFLFFFCEQTVVNRTRPPAFSLFWSPLDVYHSTFCRICLETLGRPLLFLFFSYFCYSTIVLRASQWRLFPGPTMKCDFFESFFFSLDFQLFFSRWTGLAWSLPVPDDQ